jgi:hypothetical protein
MRPPSHHPSGTTSTATAASANSEGEIAIRNVRSRINQGNISRQATFRIDPGTSFMVLFH